jgi:hypothetical protein
VRASSEWPRSTGRPCRSTWPPSCGAPPRTWPTPPSLTGWHELFGDAQYRLANIWPNTKIDIAGFDPYNWYGTVKSNGVIDTKQVDMKKDYFDPISTWADSKGMAWAVAEIGYTNTAHEVDPTWLPRTFAGLKADHGIAMTYFNTPLKQRGELDLGTRQRRQEGRLRRHHGRDRTPALSSDPLHDQHRTAPPNSTATVSVAVLFR